MYIGHIILRMISLSYFFGVTIMVKGMVIYIYIYIITQWFVNKLYWCAIYPHFNMNIRLHFSIETNSIIN